MINQNQNQQSRRVEFKPPEGFSPPENVEPGKDFDLVCSFQVKPTGELCLTKLGDHAMPGYDGKEGHDETKEHMDKPDYGEYSKSIMDAAPQTSGY